MIDYRGILYQMGNSPFHRFIYENLLRHPGIVTLHDFCLAGFQWWYSHALDGTDRHFLGEVDEFRPGRAAGYRRPPGGLDARSLAASRSLAPSGRCT